MVMLLFSCQEEKKMEFIHSKAIKSLFLIKILQVVILY